MSEPSHSWSDFFGRVESSVSDGESRDAAASLSVPASPPQRIDTVLQRTPGVSTMYTIEEQSEDEFLEDNSAEEARAAHSERTGTNSQKKSSSPKKRNAALERGMRHYGSMSEKPECESAGHEWQQRNREGPSNFAGSMEPLTGQQPSYGQDLELEIKRFTEIIHRAFAPGASGASLESARQLNQFVARGSAPDRATEAQKSYRHYSKDQESQDDVASDERSNGYHPLCSSM